MRRAAACMDDHIDFPFVHGDSHTADDIRIVTDFFNFLLTSLEARASLGKNRPPVLHNQTTGRSLHFTSPLTSHWCRAVPQAVNHAVGVFRTGNPFLGASSNTVSSISFPRTKMMQCMSSSRRPHNLWVRQAREQHGLVRQRPARRSSYRFRTPYEPLNRGLPLPGHPPLKSVLRRVPS